MSRKIKDIPISPLLKKTALKPCPFCGGKAERKETEKYIGLGRSIPQYYIRCGNEDCSLYVATCNRDTEEEAVEIWNRRATE